MTHKWRVLLLLALAELLGMAVWFSASVVVPVLTDEWALTDGGRAWLTMSVQIGFVVGALTSAVLALADRIKAKQLMAMCSICAGVCTLLIALLAQGLGVALVLRFLSGVFLAGVYPIGMKIMATWTREDRGLGIGLLVAALTLGSAAPHLLNVFGGVETWRGTLTLAGGLALLGGIIAILFVEEGPYQTPSVPFDIRLAGRILRDRDVVLANMGYLGHMWELYAMWTWVPVFVALSFAAQGIEDTWAKLLAFGVIGIGGLGSLLAGKLADRVGRTTVTSASLLISGGISLIIGQFWRQSHHNDRVGTHLGVCCRCRFGTVFCLCK